MNYTQIAPLAQKLNENISRVIVGKQQQIELILTALLSGGHVLLEDVPGTGKTTMAKALSKSLSCQFSRVQFTPDLLPADITGMRIYNQSIGEFTFIKGPAFTNILLADEINRATPRTQSALLECMEERQISEGGITYSLADPFLVIATQNPVETQGTFPLPEAQLDRFLMRLSLGYPNQQESVVEVIKEWEVKNRRPKDKMVALIRQYKPDVVMLHDVDGEYGHTAHMAFSWLGQQGVERAADAAEHPESAENWGVWDVPKTYIHLWPENQLRMDWHQPLSAFGGKTGLEMAAEGFACHASQQERWRVQDGGEWDNALFGLWRTTVGPDVEKNDLFENIPAR